MASNTEIVDAIKPAIWRRFIGVLSKLLLLTAAAVGAVWLAVQLAVAIGLVPVPRAEVIYRSPNGGREVNWTDFRGTSKLFISHSGYGPHIIEPSDTIKSGEPYFAHWRSNDWVDVFVSPDFMFEGDDDRRGSYTTDGFTINIIRLKYDPVTDIGQEQKALDNVARAQVGGFS